MEGSKMDPPIPESTQEIDFSPISRKLIWDGQKDGCDSNQTLSVKVKEDDIGSALTFKSKIAETQDIRVDESGEIWPSLKVKKATTYEDQVKYICSQYNNCVASKQVVSFNKKKMNDSDLRDVQFDTGGKAVFPWTAPDGGKFYVKEFDRKKGNKVNPDEILIPLLFPGDGIVKMQGLKYDGDKLWILMEDAGQSLRENIRDCYLSNSENVLDFTQQLMKSLALLETKDTVHRDIKPSNICVSKKDRRWKFTLVDFESAQRNREEIKSSRHTMEYLPPNLIRIMMDQKEKMPPDAFFNEKCDVWAVALIVLEILLTRHPYPFVHEYLNPCAKSKRHSTFNMTDARINAFNKIIVLKADFFERMLCLLPNPIIKEILQNTLVIDRNKSWTAKDVCDHLESKKRHYTTAFDTGNDQPQPRIKRRLLQADAKTVITGMNMILRLTPNKAEGLSHESQQLVKMKSTPMVAGLNQQMSDRNLPAEPTPTGILTVNQNQGFGVLKHVSNVQPFDEETEIVCLIEQDEIAVPSTTTVILPINQSQPFVVSHDEVSILQPVNDETMLPNFDLIEQGDNDLNCQPESTL